MSERDPRAALAQIVEPEQRAALDAGAADSRAPVETWDYIRAAGEDLRRVCACVRLHWCGMWAASSTCDACHGKGRPKVPRIFPPKLRDLGAWAAKPCLSAAEYQAVLEHELLTRELERLRLEEEDPG